MKIEASNVEEYISKLTDERKQTIQKLRKVILKSIPDGFIEKLSYGMIGYVVPHNLYPPGYHANPDLPLPFCHLSSQKNFIGFYHMGIYANPELHDWFVREYKKYAKYKLDMGKSCVRLKKLDDIPYGVIGQLMSRMSVKQWISEYEASKKRLKK